MTPARVHAYRCMAFQEQERRQAKRAEALKAEASERARRAEIADKGWKKRRARRDQISLSE